MRKEMQKDIISDEAEQKTALYMMELFDTFYMNHGIQHLLDKASEIFDRPMLVHDTSFKVLAYTFGMEQILTISEDEDGDHFLNKEIIQFIHENDAIRKIRQVGGTIYFNKPHSEGGTLLGVIKINGIESAHLAVHEAGKPFTDTERLLVVEFCKLLSLELQKDNSFLIDKNLLPSHLFADILEGLLVSEDVIRYKLHSIKWSHSEELSVMVINDKKQAALNSRIPIVIKALKLFLPMNHCMIYKSNIIVFLDLTLQKRLMQDRKAEFEEFLEMNHLCAGVSKSFHKLYECKKYYDQGAKAAAFAQQQNLTLLFFENCVLYILAELIQTHHDMLDFVHPAVQKLMKYDKQTGSSLLLTLKLYIRHTNAPNEAAKALNIHRNTLFYRINKIKDMTGIKLGVIEDTLKIYFSITLLEINHVISFEERIEDPRVET